MATAPKVLIIDDDRDFTALASSHLRGAGYETLVAFDPVQGFMVAQRESPQVIVLDVNLPAGGGVPLLQKLRATARTNGIPVVVVTGKRSPPSEADVKAEGAAAFLTKPVDQLTLVLQVKELLEPTSP